MSDTQQKTVVPIGEKERISFGTAQWRLETHADIHTPAFHQNNLKVFICGEEAFNQIAEDLKQAKSSVEIICWGFDPAMELTRHKTVWPRGDTWGGLLKEVAEGKYNQGKPVQVRLLSWYGFIGNKATDNMPGYGKVADYELKAAAGRGMGAALYPGGPDKMPPLPPPTEPRDQREVFNSHWYEDAFNRKLENLSIRTRDGSSKAVSESLEGESGKRGFLEILGMKQVATDHQKTILIDYEHEGGAHAVGYVMGLNSVTDYWDTQKHLFHDPKRGESWEGDTQDGRPGLKPYQDYACSIRGEALVAVSKNFTDAWNRAKGNGSSLSRTHDVHNPPAGLTKNLDRMGTQGAQILRTQPEEGDKSIKRLYQQASSFARQYLYIENQYFQYTDWAQQVKSDRRAFVRGWIAGNRLLKDLPVLHVMAVIPTPERPQMVPRTYDTVTALGRGTSMPSQDKQIEDELARHEWQQAQWKAHLQKQEALGLAPAPNMVPTPLSALAKSARDIGSNENVAKELAGQNVRTLVGSLWTFDHSWRTTQAKDIERAGDWADMPHATQRYKAMTESLLSNRYREIYIHSKLMVIDDSMFTLGSANLSFRSMAVDAEINVASDDPLCTTDLRRRVWDLHTGGADNCNPDGLDRTSMKKAFGAWQDLMAANSLAQTKGDAPVGFVFSFHDERTSRVRLG